MARTEVRSAQIKDGGVKRDDLNDATTGQAVVRKLVAGSNINFSSTGVDAGTGDVTINSIFGVQVNNSFLQWRNFADSIDIDVLKVDANDDTVLNSPTDILFQISGATKWQITTSGQVLPNTTNAFNIGSNTNSVANIIVNRVIADSSHNLELWAGNAYQLELTSTGDLKFQNTVNAIGTNTSDSSDNASLQLTGGGAPFNSNRGAFINLFGNEDASRPGRLHLFAGAVAGGNITISTTTTEPIQFFTNSAQVWQMNSAGDFVNMSGNSTIRPNTSDAADNRFLFLAGGGAASDTRGGMLLLYGNEHASLPGRVSLVAGNVASAEILFQTGNSSRWKISNAGDVAGLQTTNIIRANTSDTSDNASLELSGGGAVGSNRGALLRFHGNEHASSPGAIQFTAGNVTGGNIQFAVTGAVRWLIETDGTLVFRDAVGIIRSNRADAADTVSLQLTGGGSALSTRGAIIELFGNENASTGSLNLSAGNVTGGEIKLFTNGVQQWTLDKAGSFRKNNQDGFFGLGTSSTKTIATGAITATRSIHAVSGEGGGADDLDTISGGSQGDILILTKGTAVVTVKDGTGNLRLAGDFVINGTDDTIMLIFNSSVWLELSRSNNN